MEKKTFGNREPDALPARAMRGVLDHESEYHSRAAATSSVSQKLVEMLSHLDKAA